MHMQIKEVNGMENEYLFSELDQYLFGHATHYDLYKKLGAHPINIDGVEGTYFAVWAPNAQRVSVIGEFNDWDTEANIIENKDDIGVWQGFIPGAVAGQMYKYFIIGYQVNEWVNWYNLGYSADHMDRQIKQYAGVFRLADLALRSHSADSRVYVPLSNLWATGRPFLTAFAAEMGSDTAWSVAVAPYASSALDDSIWDDPGAKNDPYSTYLTMNNIGILKEFLEETPYLYQNKRRAVIVDDFAVHGTSGDTASQERQAASFVYAYYQAVNAEFLDYLASRDRRCR